MKLDINDKWMSPIIEQCLEDFRSQINDFFSIDTREQAKDNVREFIHLAIKEAIQEELAIRESLRGIDPDFD